MITLCRDDERRHLRHGRQETWLTFDPRGRLADGFGALVALDQVALPPGQSTAPRRCDDGELVTYVYRGALSQQGSAGSSAVIHAGEFQCRSTSRRVRLEETNPSRSSWAHLFRVCLRPAEAGPGGARAQERFTAAQRRNLLCAVASPDGRRGSLRIHQDALVFSSILEPGHHLVHELPRGRGAWLHLICGEATLHDFVMTRGDGAGVVNEPSVSLTILEPSELLLVEVDLLQRRSEGGGAPSAVQRRNQR